MKAIDKALDAEFAKYIRRRDASCVLCGKPTTDCAHLFAGRHASTKWDEECAFGLCHECHMHQHQDEPSILIDYAKRVMGERVYDGLMQQHNSIKRWTHEEKLALLDFLRKA